MSFPIGMTLNGHNNRYHIEKSLGHGSISIVYKASDAQGKTVAIKEYFPHGLATRIDGSMQVEPNSNAPEAKEFFYRQKIYFLEEAKHMKRFKDDPHIVNVFDCFEANGTAYIVMEFIQGNTLSQAMYNWDEKKHRMPLKNVIDDLAPIVDVSERIHSMNLIHGDISPDNIIFTSRTIKLMETGFLAKPVFLHGIAMENPYKPLEQFLDPEDLVRVWGICGSWTDVYSLAATIYKAITGKSAPHATEQQFVALSGKDTLKKPSSFGIAITPQQEQALLKALELNYKERYQTVREFFNALKAESLPIEIQTSSPKPWWKKLFRLLLLCDR